MSEKKIKKMEEEQSAAAEKEQALTMTEKTVRKQDAAEEKVQDLMYIGPTVTGVIRHSTVFKSGVLTQKVKECVDEFPAMKRLFITTDCLPEAVRELRNSRSVLSAICTQVETRFIQNEGRK